MAFDTERAARRLADAGMEERAANGVADVMADATDGLATEASVNAGFAALREDMARLEGRLDTRIAQVDTRIAQVDVRIAELETRMIKWLIAAVVAGASASAAIVTIVARLLG